VEAFGDDAFNEFGFRSIRQAVRVQEAPTHFSTDRDRGESSLCGDFAEFSVPAPEFEPMREFWEKLGFVALTETDVPYVRMSMTSDYLDLAVHRARTLDQPMLVFAAADMGERIDRLRSLDVVMADDLPRGLDPRHRSLAACARRHGPTSYQRGRLSSRRPAREDREIHSGEQEERPALRDGIVNQPPKALVNRIPADAQMPASPNTAPRVTRRFLPEQRLALMAAIWPMPNNAATP
jgi:hypothetical protein